jgi:predicted TIM-barrel fold metal-dependent hydrolase
MPTVDLHHHAPLASYVERLTAIGQQAQPGADFPSWQPADSLDLMDDLGIDIAVLSIGSPGFYFGDQQFTTDLCRDSNDELIEVVRADASRFAALICVPLPSVDAALTELDRVWGRPEFVGVTLLSNYGGQYVGNPIFDPLLAELDTRQAVVHVHPRLPAVWPEGEIPLRPSVLEYLFDTTRMITNLMLAGVPDRFPGIRWVFSHCGGALPVVAPRMVLAESMPEMSGVPAPGVLGTLNRFYYDTALSNTAADLGALLSFVDGTQVVLGSDFPFSDATSVGERLQKLGDVVDADLLARIRSDNAIALLPTLGTPGDTRQVLRGAE